MIFYWQKTVLALALCSVTMALAAQKTTEQWQNVYTGTGQLSCAMACNDGRIAGVGNKAGTGLVWTYNPDTEQPTEQQVGKALFAIAQKTDGSLVVGGKSDKGDEVWEQNGTFKPVANDQRTGRIVGIGCSAQDRVLVFTDSAGHLNAYHILNGRLKRLQVDIPQYKNLIAVHRDPKGGGIWLCGNGKKQPWSLYIQADGSIAPKNALQNIGNEGDNLLSASVNEDGVLLVCGDTKLPFDVYEVGWFSQVTPGTPYNKTARLENCIDPETGRRKESNCHNTAIYRHNEQIYACLSNATFEKTPPTVARFQNQLLAQKTQLPTNGPFKPFQMLGSAKALFLVGNQKDGFGVFSLALQTPSASNTADADLPTQWKITVSYPIEQTSSTLKNLYVELEADQWPAKTTDHANELKLLRNNKEIADAHFVRTDKTAANNSTQTYQLASDVPLNEGENRFSARGPNGVLSEEFVVKRRKAKRALYGLFIGIDGNGLTQSISSCKTMEEKVREIWGSTPFFDTIGTVLLMGNAQNQGLDRTMVWDQIQAISQQIESQKGRYDEFYLLVLTTAHGAQRKDKSTGNDHQVIELSNYKHSDRNTWLDLDRDLIDPLPAGIAHCLLLLDVCRDGSTENFRVKPLQKPVGLIYATQPGQRAFEGPKGLTIFTEVVIERHFRKASSNPILDLLDAQNWNSRQYPDFKPDFRIEQLTHELEQQ